MGIITSCITQQPENIAIAELASETINSILSKEWLPIGAKRVLEDLQKLVPKDEYNQKYIHLTIGCNLIGYKVAAGCLTTIDKMSYFNPFSAMPIEDNYAPNVILDVIYKNLVAIMNKYNRPKHPILVEVPQRTGSSIDLTFLGDQSSRYNTKKKTITEFIEQIPVDVLYRTHYLTSNPRHSKLDRELEELCRKMEWRMKINK